MTRLSMAERLKKSGTETVSRLDEAQKRLKDHDKASLKVETPQHSDTHSGRHSNKKDNTESHTVTGTLTDTLIDTKDNIAGNTQDSILNSIPTNILLGTPGIDEYLWMTTNQAKVLIFISRLPSGKTKLRDISNQTGVCYGTVRTSIDTLYKHSCITKPRKIRIGQWQGLHIELLEAGKKWVSLNSSKVNTLNNTLTITNGSTLNNRHSNRQSISHFPYSSSSLNKATTLIETHPELGYWLQKGLKPKQVETWAKEFTLSEEDIIESLCYCKFDMVDNGREEKDKIEDVFAWFYKIVQRAGTYPKPKKYKSHQEMCLEREKARLAEIKRQTEELRKIRQESIKARYELEFEQMLQNPDDPTYQQCRKTLPPFLKNRKKSGSIAFMNAMKAAFFKLNDIENS